MATRSMAPSLCALLVLAPVLCAQSNEYAAGKTRLLAAPFAAPRDSFLYAALDVPRLESAWSLARGDVFARLSSRRTASWGSDRIDGVRSRFNGTFRELVAAEVRWAALDGLELAASASFGGWDEDQDVFFLFNGADVPIVRDEAGAIDEMSGASKRHDNLVEVVLGAKVVLVESVGHDAALSVAGSVRVPVARDRDLSHSGTYDLAATLLATQGFGALTLHANLGVGVPVGRQTLFERFERVRLDPFVHGGLGVNWRLADWLAAIAQFEANTSAFGDVRFLDGPVATVFGGLRAMWGRFVLEFGGGTGLLRETSYDYAFAAAAGYLF